MNLFSRVIFPVFSCSLFAGIVYSATIPNTDHPTTFVGPTLKARLVNRLVEDRAYSLAGEAGAKNMRIGATYGWKFTECQRLKISAEYLWQDITYPFFSGNTDSWMNQGAAGLAYQYDFAYSFFYPQFELGAYGSHSGGKALGFINSYYVNPQGFTIFFNDARRIAGANARGVNASLGISPWQGSRIIATLNYDDVDYRTKYLVTDEDNSGVGGTLQFSQLFSNYAALGARASVRSAYNYYNANITFTRVPFLCCSWTLGFFADYVTGKHKLPDTYNLGVTASYYMDQTLEDYDYRARGITALTNDRMLVSVATPAVYMPQVLAIPDNITVQF